MKQVEVIYQEHETEAVLHTDLFEDDAVLENEGNFIRVADGTHCVLVSTNGMRSIGLYPAEEAGEFLSDDACAAKCEADCCDDCLGHCDKSCECHAYEKNDEQFDCGGECKHRCFECKTQQDRIDEEEGNDTA